MPRNNEDFVRQIISARDMQAGDFLDVTRKVRVHTVKEHNGSILAGHKLRGSKAPGVNMYEPDQQVSVYRKQDA